MNKHEQAATTALNRLYQRLGQLGTPLASDAATLRVGLKAVKEMASGAPAAPEPVSLSIAQVKQAIDEGKMTLQEALKAEQASDAPRKTLLAWLEEELEGDDE